MDRKRDSLVNEIKELQREIADLKTKQPITGDSWVPYRYTGIVTIPLYEVRWLKFTPKYPDMKTTLMEVSDNFMMLKLPVKFGDSYYICYPNLWSSGGTTDDYSLLSTQEGTVTIQSTNPY